MGVRLRRDAAARSTLDLSDGVRFSVDTWRFALGRLMSCCFECIPESDSASAHLAVGGGQGRGDAKVPNKRLQRTSAGDHDGPRFPACGGAWRADRIASASALAAEPQVVSLGGLRRVIRALVMSLATLAMVPTAYARIVTVRVTPETLATAALPFEVSGVVAPDSTEYVICVALRQEFGPQDIPAYLSPGDDPFGSEPVNGTWRQPGVVFAFKVASARIPVTSFAFTLNDRPMVEWRELEGLGGATEYVFDLRAFLDDWTSVR